MVLGALIGAAGSIGAGFLGARAESDAAEKNWQINLLNYYSRERERQEANFQAGIAKGEATQDKYLARRDALESRDYSRKQAERGERVALEDRALSKKYLTEDRAEAKSDKAKAEAEKEEYRAEAKLGNTDANGNRTYYKEGVGWVSELSPVMQALQDKYLVEERAVLDNDLPKQRELLNRNINRQRKEGDEADNLLWRMKQAKRTSAKEVEDELNGAAANGIQAGFGSALQEAMQTALRTGSSNAGGVAASIGRERSKALQEAFIANKINSRGQADQRYNDEVSNLGNLYNAFASRASADPNIGYNPRNLSGPATGGDERIIGGTGPSVAAATAGSRQAERQSGNALMDAISRLGQAGGTPISFVNGVPAANSAMINAAGMQGGSLSAIQPNFGWANALGGASSAISSMAERYKKGKGDY